MCRTVPILMVLFVASLAQAQGWKQCDVTHGAGPPRATVGAKQAICYDYTGTTDSNPLSLILCMDTDIRFTSSYDTTDHDSTVQIMGCPGPIANTNACEPIQNATLDGKAETDTDILNGAGEGWIYVHPVANASARKSRVMVRCVAP